MPESSSSDTVVSGPADAVHAALREVFGFTVFRRHQEEVVRAILDGSDAFVVMPTGGGKSLCFQLPAHVLPGTCLVVSPLISLMKDQVDAARANGLRAACLNSAMRPDDRRRAAADLRAGRLDLLYVAPERLFLDGFLAFLDGIRISFIAVDEAHCISEWGHDFRPDYLALSQLPERFPGVPIAAFTATATHRVQEDILQRLALRQPHVVRASFNRPNLFYETAPKDRVDQQVLAFVLRHGESGIVYRTTRKSVEKTAAVLCDAGIRALPYHAGLEDSVRAANQEAFNRDEVQVIVATIAFGMGIDKSNVRFVVHADLPKNIEGYYQETGRAGRDGDPARCLLLFSYGDIAKIRHFIRQVEDPDERQRAERNLQQMIRYANVYACRRRQLLQYFGETLPDGNDGPCCDICAGQVNRVDATREAQMLLSAIARTGERFGAGHIIDVVSGADTERIRRLGHDQLKTYGCGNEIPKSRWRGILDNLLAQDFARQTDGEYPVLALSERARDVLFNGETVYILESQTIRAPRRKRHIEPLPEGDGALFERLRALRTELAAKRGVPPYVIFNDRTLHDMATRKPRTPEEMALVSGVGQHKLRQFGARFLAAIDAYLDPPGSHST